ncbi:hypothetical protein P8452_25404 [Trifolium repens]|nr:hypothetical protein P8452_25404 [Trifolium repens]
MRVPLAERTVRQIMEKGDRQQTESRRLPHNNFFTIFTVINLHRRRFPWPIFTVADFHGRSSPSMIFTPGIFTSSRNTFTNPNPLYRDFISFRFFVASHLQGLVILDWHGKGSSTGFQPKLFTFWTLFALLR